MVVKDYSEDNAMCLVASMAAEDISAELGVSETEALGLLLSSKTGRQLFDPSLKLWWDGPTYVANTYLCEAGYGELADEETGE